MLGFRNKSFKDFDYILLITIIILSIFGLVILKSATATLTKNGFLVGPSIIKSQVVSTILGFVLILFLTLIDYKLWGKLYIPIYITCILLLVAVKMFGIGTEQWGAQSWLRIGGYIFQPSEMVKIGLIISLGQMLENNQEKLNEPFVLIKILIFAFLPVGLIMLQPDMGTALVFIFFIAVMLYVAGIQWRYIGYAFLLGFLMLPVAWQKLDTYQKDRFFDFLDPSRGVAGTGYQSYQGRIALGSGKLFGRGLFKGVQTQNGFLPARENDFIFSVLVEELGFIGGLSLISLYYLLLYRFIAIGKRTQSLFGSSIVLGFAAMLIFHIWENIGMNIGLMPVTGIPLPFVSQGGTFQLTNLICIGLVLSVSIHKDEKKYTIEDNAINNALNIKP